MTDLENFVNQSGRDKLVKDVRKKIDELGITYIYYQFVSVTGRIVGKGVPADHWESMAEKGFQLVYGATANLFVDRHGDYIGYGPESSELVGIPEPDCSAGRGTDASDGTADADNVDDGCVDTEDDSGSCCSTWAG